MIGWFAMWVAEVKDPVHGYIYLNELERRVVDSPPFQRLRRISQLAGADLTYPGATHTRFLHSLGVMHLAGLAAERFRDRGYLTQDDVQLTRLAGLLHDLGHGPFSHVYDEVLDRHRGMTHEDVTQWLVRESVVGDILEDGGFSRVEVSQLAVGRLKSRDTPFLNHIITGPLSIDIMDYLIRDSYFAGVEYGRVDVRRLIDSIDLVDGKMAVEYPGALPVLESFILARLQMFNAVYFHRSVRAANVMLGRAMEYADEALALTKFDSVEDFLRLYDASVLLRMANLEGDGDAQVARKFALMYLNRELVKCTYELTVHTPDSFTANILNKESIRRKIEEEISEEAGVDPRYVFIDVPSVPSVPLHPDRERGMDIMFYRRTADGRRPQPLSEVPSILAHLAKYIDVIRVYAPVEWRGRVEEACRGIFEASPPSSRVSM